MRRECLRALLALCRRVLWVCTSCQCSRGWGRGLTGPPRSRSAMSESRFVRSNPAVRGALDDAFDDDDAPLFIVVHDEEPLYNNVLNKRDSKSQRCQNRNRNLIPGHHCASYSTSNKKLERRRRRRPWTIWTMTQKSLTRRTTTTSTPQLESARSRVGTISLTSCRCPGRPHTRPRRSMVCPRPHDTHTHRSPSAQTRSTPGTSTSSPSTSAVRHTTPHRLRRLTTRSCRRRMAGVEANWSY